MILRSEGEKESNINQAEAVKQSEILRAEGESKAKILMAQGEAEAIRRITEAINSTEPDPPTSNHPLKYIETLNQMVSGKDNKTIYIPYEASNLLSSIGSIKEIFNK